MATSTISLRLVECNIDDMIPEVYPYVIEKLFDAGARDAWVTPIIMKRGRPGHCVSALCDSERQQSVTEVLLKESTTLGVRVSNVERTELTRAWESVETEYGAIRMKLGKGKGDEVVNASPEHEDCYKAAKIHGTPLKVVYQAAIAGWKCRK